MLQSTFSWLHSVAISVRLAVVIGSQICEISRNSKRIRVYSRSGSSKVMDLGVNRKRICDFINSNFGRISYHRDIDV